MVSFVQMVTNMEAEMPAIERMFEYSQLENEYKTNNKLVEKYPSNKKEGNEGLDITNVVMKYRPDLPPALNGVDVHIAKGEHVAIVGRTGSGKSSLAITLFKLYQPDSGLSI